VLVVVVLIEVVVGDDSDDEGEEGDDPSTKTFKPRESLLRGDDVTGAIC